MCTNCVQQMLNYIMYICLHARTHVYDSQSRRAHLHNWDFLHAGGDGVYREEHGLLQVRHGGEELQPTLVQAELQLELREVDGVLGVVQGHVGLDCTG